MELKDLIRKRREELNLTYEQLGKMVGVGKSTVRKWETGMIENMRRDNIVALSKALDISPSDIMGWNTENESDEHELKNLKVENELKEQMEFYKILIDIMNEKNLSIPDVARLTSLSDSTIRSIITRKTKNISLEVAFKLSKGLDVSLERLNGDDLGLEETKFNLEPQPITLTQDESILLTSYNKLNDIGKHEAKKRVNELTSIPNYIDVTNIEGAREYLKLFKMAAYGGQDINLLPDEKIIERAIALKEEFEK